MSDNPLLVVADHNLAVGNLWIRSDGLGVLCGHVFAAREMILNPGDDRGEVWLRHGFVVELTRVEQVGKGKLLPTDFQGVSCTHFEVKDDWDDVVNLQFRGVVESRMAEVT